MKSIAFYIVLIIGLASCQTDDFFNVTKIIEVPNTIEVDKPFTLRLKLINETESTLPLTLDRDITKSVQFFPRWYCGDDFMHSKTPNPKKKKNDFYSVNLTPGDSLVFELTAQIKHHADKDSLVLMIEEYEKDFRLATPDCKNLYMDFRGMWIPGNGPLGDSMEGYDFRTKVEVETTANPKK